MMVDTVRELSPEQKGEKCRGTIRILYFKNQQIFLSELLSGHDIALEEIADGIWSIYFYTLLLARLDVRTFTLSV